MQEIGSIIRFIKARNIPRLSREVIWITLGKGLSIVGGLVGVRLLSEFMDPAGYGELALYMTISTLVAQLGYDPVRQAAQRFYPIALEESRLNAYYLGLRWILARMTGVIVLLAVLIYLIVRKFAPELELTALVVTLIMSVWIGISSAIGGIQQAARDRVVVAFHQSVSRLLRSLLAAGVILLLGSSSRSALIGYALGAGVMLLSHYFFLRRRMPAIYQTGIPEMEDEPRVWAKRALSYGLPLAIWGLFSWAQLSSDRWALGVFSGTNEVGLYAILYQVGYFPMLTVWEAVFAFFSPILYSWAGDASNPARLGRARKATNLVVLASLLLTGVLAILGWLLHPLIFRIVADESFWSVSWLLPLAILGGGLYAAGQIAVVSSYSGLRTQVILWPKVIVGTIGVGLNFIGAYYDGVRGVIFAIALSAAIYFAWMMWLANRRIPKP